MARSSLRLRLIAGGVAATLVALALAGGGLVHLFRLHVARTIGEDLDVHLRQLVGGLERNGASALVVEREPVDPRFSEPLSGLYWQADGAGALIRSRSLWDSRIDLPEDALAPGEVHRHLAIGPAGQRVLIAERMVTLGAPASEARVRVVVAADLARVNRAVGAFARELALALGMLALVLVTATALQVGLGLRPLDRLRASVAQVRAGTIRRLETTVPREVLPLAEEINALLDAQDREVERSRGRAADLAHGLKTPLAALAGDVERLRASGQAEIARDIEQVGNAMSRHVDRELARARVRGSAGAQGGRSIEIAPLVRSIAAMLARAPRDREVRLDIEMSSGLTLPFDRDDLAEVLGNLLENAMRHARSRVRVRGSSQAGDVTLEIDDDGEGIAPEARAAMLARGGRLDTRGGAAGLGLAIVQDVLDAYGWRLRLDGSDLGGLKVHVGRDAARVRHTGSSA